MFYATPPTNSPHLPDFIHSGAGLKIIFSSLTLLRTPNGPGGRQYGGRADGAAAAGDHHGFGGRGAGRIGLHQRRVGQDVDLSVHFGAAELAGMESSKKLTCKGLTARAVPSDGRAGYRHFLPVTLPVDSSRRAAPGRHPHPRRAGAGQDVWLVWLAGAPALGPDWMAGPLRAVRARVSLPCSASF